MIGALARDTVLLLLRGRPVLLLAGVGLLVGLFVRATRDAGVERLQGAVLPGAALETMVGALFLLLVAWGIVAGLVLAHEDRASGFFVHLALRPVSRGRYVAGRMLGLVLATALAAVPLVGLGALVAGLGERDVPSIRERVRPSRVEIGGEELPARAFGHVTSERPGRFMFPAGARPEATLRLRPKIPIGAAFSGRLEVRVTYTPVGGAPQTWEPEPFRPLRALEIHFEDAPRDGFTLTLEPRDETFVLEVDRDSLTTLGPAASLAAEVAKGALLLLLAGLVSAASAFFFGVGLSAGPASLAAGFVTLVALGRAAVLDVVAGIGARGPDGGDPSALLGWLRSTLTHLVRVVPDLSRFNPAERLGEGEALRGVELAGATSVAGVTIGAVLLLCMAVLPLRER